MNESHIAPDADNPLPRRRANTPSDNAPETHIFLVRENASISGTLYVIGGVTLLGFAMLAFIVCLVVRVSQITLQLTTTLPVLMGLAAVARGWGAVRSPSQITVDPEEISITTGQTDRRIPWSDIGLASATSSPLSHRRRLTLFDHRGKPLTTIDSNFTDFEQLVDLARGYVNTQPDGVSGSLQLKKARRTALFTGVMGVFVGVGSCFAVYDAWNTARSESLLASSGVEGEGRILRRFLAPNGVTCRLEYEVQGDGGRTAIRNAEMERPAWEALEDAESVPIRYLAAEPDISRLLAGEVPPEGPGLMGGYGLGTAGALMSLLMIGTSVMQFQGWDFGTDPKTKKVGFRRIGT